VRLCFSVLDLNAFERQNKAEGLGMVTEEGSGELHHFSIETQLLSTLILLTTYGLLI